MDNIALAHRLFDHIEEGDFGAFAAMFSDDAVMWHNFDMAERPVKETAPLIARARSGLKTWRYEDRRPIAVPDGVVWQHVLHASNNEGRTFEAPAMIHIYFDNGLIVRFEEYFDLRQQAGMNPQMAL